MLRVICVRTGTKYDQWYEDNLRHMIDNYSGLEYDKFCVIRDNVYQDTRGVFNKLLMFDYYRDGQNIYFDLDILIKGKCEFFLRKNFTLCHAWWRKQDHTPFNSSIMSWQGDCSHIHQKFADNKEEFLNRYQRGMDQFIWEQIKGWEVYRHNFCSFQTVSQETNTPVYLFNQRYKEMVKDGWWQKYFLERP